MNWRSQRKLCLWERFQAFLGATQSPWFALLFYTFTAFLFLPPLTLLWNQVFFIYLFICFGLNPVVFLLQQGADKILPQGISIPEFSSLDFICLIAFSIKNQACLCGTVYKHPARCFPTHYHPSSGIKLECLDPFRSFLNCFCLN